MASRRKFIQQGGNGLLASLILPFSLSPNDPNFAGLVVDDEDGETVRIRDGKAIVKIKIAKTQGSNVLSFLSEMFTPGDAIPVHKHLHEDELIFLYKGKGEFTLGENVFQISEGAVAVVPRGVWHGLRNTGAENIEMRFAYSPAGFEGFFREVGTPVDQPFVTKTLEEKVAIRKKWGIVFKS
jgi:quercetin dioxygenase-like cupin family protein